MKTMTPSEEIPFVPILENERLNAYFDANVSNLTDDVWLYPLLQEYALDDESIEGLKDKLNRHVEQSLRQKIDGFSMMKFVLFPETYPYLKPESTAERIALMEDRALPFVRYKAAMGNRTDPSNLFLTKIEPGERVRFTDILNRFCKIRPVVTDTEDTSKLTLVRIKNISLTELD